MSAGRRIAYLAASADGFIADAHGQVGWLERFGVAEDFGFAEFVGGVDALLMGRRTFDQLVGFGGAWPYGARPVMVLTHRPLPANAPASVRAANAQELAAALANAPGRIWIVGGGETLAFCLASDLVDELQLFLMPVLLGEGARLAAVRAAVGLALQDCEMLARGVVKLTYAPLPAKAKTAPTPATGQSSAGSEPADPYDPTMLAPFPPEANAEKDA